MQHCTTPSDQNKIGIPGSCSASDPRMYTRAACYMSMHNWQSQDQLSTLRGDAEPRRLTYGLLTLRDYRIFVSSRMPSFALSSDRPFPRLGDRFTQSVREPGLLVYSTVANSELP